MGAFPEKKKKEKKREDVRQYFPVQPMGSYAGQREVNVLVQHAPTRRCCSLRLGVGGERREHMAGALQTQQDGALQIVQCDESQTLTQHCFEWLFGGSESGSTFSNADLF